MVSGSLLGDPASVAALAGVLRRRSAELSSATADLEGAHAEARDGWVGPTAVRHRRRIDQGVATTRVCTAQMLTLADALEAFGTALAETRQVVREVQEQAEAVGLDLVDGAIVPRWGIRGEAAARESQVQEETSERLARRLARATTLLERRRTNLARCAEEVAGTLR